MARTAANKPKPDAPKRPTQDAESASCGTASSEAGSEAGSEGRARRAPGEAEDSDVPFEEALAKLEEVVDRLESGDLELEASLTAFEEGVRLSKRCAGQLDAAEQRVEILVREGGALTRRLFEDLEGAASGAGEDEDLAAEPG
jgi:exodeoxyribonuclease VII small subunit